MIKTGWRAERVVGAGAAVLSSALGGTAIVGTRFLSSELHPVTIGLLRFGLGCLLLLPLARLERRPWPTGRGLLPVAALGLLFFAVFPVLFNAALSVTTAARGAVVLSSLPLVTLIAGSLFGIERVTLRTAAGVIVAFAGVGLTLALGVAASPDGAWRGDLLMFAATLCMALYTIWSRQYIAASGPLTFTAVAMAFGSAGLALVALVSGRLTVLPSLGPLGWSAVAYLAVVGAAATFALWSIALGRADPTAVAVGITVNPLVATIAAAALLHEPLSPSLVIGIVCVALGVALTARAP